MKINLRKSLTVAACAMVAGMVLTGGLVTAQDLNPGKMSFFVTSVGAPKGGGDYGGLAGADAYCTTLARAAGSPASKTWHAFLSTEARDGQPQVNARDRIGNGPWYNAKGQEIASSLNELLDGAPKWTKPLGLTEKGVVPPGASDAPAPNEHDVMTGSGPDGRLAAIPAPAAPAAGGPPAAPVTSITCNNWTSNATTGVAAMVGHVDREGRTSTSFSSAHASRGCDLASLKATGGAGRIYCFATN